MFIEIKDRQYEDNCIINTDNISIIHEGALTLTMNGVHGEGNGLLRITKEDLKRILEIVKPIRRKYEK